MRTSRGFTLAELVLAFGIATVAILSLVGVFIAGLKLAARSRDLAVAVEIGHQVLESVKHNSRTLGFSYVPNGSYVFNGRLVPATAQVGTPPALFPPAPYPTATINAQEYRIVVSGQVLSPTLKQIKAAVYYGANGRVSFETLLRP